MPGDRSQKKNAMIGGVIIVALLAVGSGVFFIQDIVRLFHPQFNVVALMADAGALEAGSHVWIAGRSVGHVKSVVIRGAAIDSIERVAVTMEIPHKYQQYVHTDSRVRLTSARLIGEPVLDIAPGSGPIVHDGDSLRTTTPGSVDALMTHSMRVSNSMRLLFAQLDELKSENSRAPEHMARINRNLQGITAQFSDLMDAIQNGPTQRLSDPAFRRAVADLRGMSGQLRDAFGAAAGRARKARNESEPALRLMRARADTIQAELGALQKQIAETGGGLLPRAQKDSAIMKAVHGAKLQLDSLMAVTKRNPWRFWF